METKEPSASIPISDPVHENLQIQNAPVISDAASDSSTREASDEMMDIQNRSADDLYHKSPKSERMEIPNIASVELRPESTSGVESMEIKNILEEETTFVSSQASNDNEQDTESMENASYVEKVEAHSAAGDELNPKSFEGLTINEQDRSEKESNPEMSRAPTDPTMQIQTASGDQPTTGFLESSPESKPNIEVVQNVTEYDPNPGPSSVSEPSGTEMPIQNTPENDSTSSDGNSGSEESDSDTESTLRPTSGSSHSSFSSTRTSFADCLTESDFKSFESLSDTDSTLSESSDTAKVYSECTLAAFIVKTKEVDAGIRELLDLRLDPLPTILQTYFINILPRSFPTPTSRQPRGCSASGTQPKPSASRQHQSARNAQSQSRASQAPSSNTKAVYEQDGKLILSDEFIRMWFHKGRIITIQEIVNYTLELYFHMGLMGRKPSKKLRKYMKSRFQDFEGTFPKDKKHVAQIGQNFRDACRRYFLVTSRLDGVDIEKVIKEMVKCNTQQYDGENAAEARRNFEQQLRSEAIYRCKNEDTIINFIKTVIYKISANLRQLPHPAAAKRRSKKSSVTIL